MPSRPAERGVDLTVELPVSLARGRKGSRKVEEPGPSPPVPTIPGSVPRISRLMALAIHFQELIDTGVVRDQAELARLGRVSRPRLTQIMNLLRLAPDIQEELLFLPRTVVGKDRVTERTLREVAAELDWGEQKMMWRRRDHPSHRGR